VCCGAASRPLLKVLRQNGAIDSAAVSEPRQTPLALSAFKDWVLPAAMERVRRKLAGADDGNRQMVDILAAVLTDGLPAVEAACAEAFANGVHSADVVLNILARQRDPGPPATILTPAALTLRQVRRNRRLSGGDRWSNSARRPKRGCGDE
jgi:hypothetical protein